MIARTHASRPGVANRLEADSLQTDFSASAVPLHGKHSSVAYLSIAPNEKPHVERTSVYATCPVDAVIIGGGPAGLVAAFSLRSKTIVVIDKGARIGKRVCPMRTHCRGCNRCGEIEGIGGAGGWSDGKLCLGPVGILERFLGGNYIEEAQAVSLIFREVLGDKYVRPSESESSCLIKSDISQEVTQVANLGTSTIRLAFERMYEIIGQAGAVFTDDRVVDVRDGPDGSFVVQTRSGREFSAKKVIIATGKCDATLVPKLVERYGLARIPVEPTIGFRLAVPNEYLKTMKSLGNNPKIKLHLTNGDTVKTHCFCYGGEVMAYTCGQYFLVGGRADYTNPTEYANTNVLYKISSGHSDERISTVHRILSKIKADYPRNVLYQDAMSFLYDERKPRETRVPACRGGMLGSLLPYYPEHFVSALREFVYDLSELYEMSLEQATIFGPASEWLNPAVETSIDMESSRPGLYFVGDGSGITQGIVAAAVTGLRAARAVANGR